MTKERCANEWVSGDEQLRCIYVAGHAGQCMVQLGGAANFDTAALIPFDPCDRYCACSRRCGKGASHEGEHGCAASLTHGSCW